MKDKEQIKRLIRNASLGTNPKKDKQILEHVLAAQEAGGVRRAPNQRSRMRMTAMSGVAKFAAAVVVLVAAGYVIGRAAAPRAPDIEQLRSDLETSLRRDLVEEIGREQQVSFARGYALLRTELDEALKRQLESYSMQTLAASSALTEQVASSLAEAIHAARVDERRRVVMALEWMEVNRRVDSAILRKDFAEFAALTGDEVLRTRHAVVNLLQEDIGNDALSGGPEEPKQRNERGTK